MLHSVPLVRRLHSILGTQLYLLTVSVDRARYPIISFLFLLTRNRAVVVNGQSPGPLLSGNKVSCDVLAWSAGLTGISGRQLQN